jgi:hypothetical protein
LPSQGLDERLFHLQNAQDASGDPKNVLRGHQECTAGLSWTVNSGSCTPRFKRPLWSMPTIIRTCRGGAEFVTCFSK